MKLAIQPHEGTFYAKHPVTGKDVFDNGDKEIQGIFKVVGSSSKEFYDVVNQTDSHLILSEISSADKLLAALIIGWDDTGFIDDPYTPEGALELITAPENLWLKLQLKDFVETQSNFF